MDSGQSPTEVRVNGASVTVDANDELMLIHFLRQDLYLSGVRPGCAIGECGSCTVLVDGSAMRSCITPVGEVAGRDILTPEGLGTPASPHPVQQAFLDEQAAQCGYCVNGIIMTVAGLSRRDTTDAELCDALDEHLCRCCTHVRLLKAARRALGHTDVDEALTGTPADADRPATGSTVDETETGSTREAPDLPPAIAANPRIEDWIELDETGQILVHVGKVELGQGIRSAFGQIVAAQLGVPVSTVQVMPTRTGRSPDQRYTAGSFSIEEGGLALAHAGAAARRAILDCGADVLGCKADELAISLAGVSRGDGNGEVTFRELARKGAAQGIIERTDAPVWDRLPLGETIPRADLQQKLTGAPAYLHDIAWPGMLHARMAFPPTPDARLLEVKLDDARALPGVVDVVHDGRIVIVLAQREEQAVRAIERLRRDLRWEEIPLEVPTDLAASFRASPSQPYPVRSDASVTELLDHGDAHSASYFTPYQAHGPVAPSAAIARLDDDHFSVWTHTQGVYPLRRELAALLSLDEDQFTVEHVDGPGCYGMNGADDAAALAVIAARAMPGRAVRFQLSVEDEFVWEPHGPAMLADLSAALDESGRLAAWRHHAVTDVHNTRPNGAGDRLVPAWLGAGGVPGHPWPGPEEGGARNAVPLYDVPALDVGASFVRGPLRTSPLRCLGAYLNIFAAESFMDEMAERAGQDPVAFRLAHLNDERARAVLELVGQKAGWTPHVGPSGRGTGIAVAHYKDSKAYVAQAAQVAVAPDDGSFRVERIVVACDAGVVIDPGGLRNQLEGGTLQGLSRALFEELHPDASGIRERSWTDYEAIGFRHLPTLEIHLVDRPHDPPLGVGESATPVVPAAVANAIDDAIGIRIRHLPLTPARMRQRLLEMDEAESSRVLV